jgi:hypothetical protein
MKKAKSIKTEVVRSIAFISDLHVGSRYAICPDKWKTAEGQWLIPSPGQVVLNNSFREFGAECDKLKVDTVLVNGDMLHGQNVMENGVGLSTSNMDEQIDMGIEVLKPLVKGRKLLMISGSGYHKSVRGLNPEKCVCDGLSGTWLGPLANIRFAPSKRLFNVHHGQSAAFIYKEMLAGREMMFSKWAQGSGKLPEIDAIIRGHLHSFMHLHENRIHYLQLPCWLAFEPSKITLKLYSKFQPDIGGVIVHLDSSDRIIPWHFLYPCPTIAGEVMEQ